MDGQRKWFVDLHSPLVKQVINYIMVNNSNL
jgi:hypothetical protein